ncbi:MAG TPA: serine hydrolase domain-containing protein [Aeromicrobium sp.]|nr:serine hydrolase domain-containing protein [Aeromicrobium sp.]
MTINPAALDAILANAVATGAVPGLAVVVVDRDGVLYSGANGTAPDTIFRYASCTKAIASVSALQLLEQGRIGLEDDVANHVPEFGKLQVLDGFDGDQPILRAPSRPPVVRELMNHTSGATYFFTDAKIARFHEIKGIPTLFAGQKAAITDVPLSNDPGTIWAYGTSTDWLGLLVERVSGKGLDEYVAEHVTGPLGMTDVTFQPTDEQNARMMPIYSRTPEGGLMEISLELPEKPEWWAGGHGLVGTVGAYGRFIQALLRGGELDGQRILQEETVALAFSDSLRGVPMPAEGMPSADPAMSNDIPPYPFAEAWGLGFHLTLEDVPGARRAGTGDWAGLFNLYYFIDRTTGVGAMLATQVLPFFDERIVDTFMEIEGTVYAGLTD